MRSNSFSTYGNGVYPMEMTADFMETTTDLRHHIPRYAIIKCCKKCNAGIEININVNKCLL